MRKAAGAVFFFFKIARQVCFGAGVATNDGIYDQKV
jgi:hypothetical protein